MSITCPTCSRNNPGNAVYCHYDGVLLATGAREAVHVGSLPFPTKFHFADGQACLNFNQLALACEDRWNDAKALLAQGVWQSFFRGMGRLDLAAAAEQASQDPDADHGLSNFLARWPADEECLKPPKVALESSEQNLGRLAPGHDSSFELAIVNKGMLLLHGTISTDCDWLVLGEAGGSSSRMFQTRSSFSIRVLVVGGKLRAGRLPLQGNVHIDTNGGSATLPVKAEVPIRPFPRVTSIKSGDVLAGAMSPRQVAEKAMKDPKGSAVLFQQGAVRRWYAGNGWDYPVDGTTSTGLSAVQQFFEALGLTKPPKLKADKKSLTFEGEVGDVLKASVTLSTEASKPVYARAWSDRDWIAFGSIEPHRNRVEIPIEINVPDEPGETVEAKVTIQGNGKQTFVVPVRVTIAEAEPNPWWWLAWAGWFAGGFAVALLTLVAIDFAIRKL